MAHSQRAQIALSKLAEEDPAYGSWALWCKHIDSDQPIAPAWTDGKTVFYGADFEGFTNKEKEADAAHELTHVAFRHPARGIALYRRLGPSYKHKTFNIAIDAITNEMLRAAGYRLPKSAIFLTDVLEKFLNIKQKPEECIAEWDSEKLYMALVRTKMSDQKQQGQKQQGGQNGQKGQQQQGNQKGQQQNGQEQDGDEDCNGNGQQQGGNGQNGQQPNGSRGNNQGKGQGQTPDPTDPSQNGQGGQGQEEIYDPTASDALEAWADQNGYKGDIDEQAIKDGAAQGAADDSMEEAEWAQRVARGLAQGKLAGQGIGKLGYKIADVPKSRTPWEQILRQLVSKAVTRMPQPSYMRPTKKFLAMDSHAMAYGLERPTYEQGWINQKGVPRVAVGVDVSGSIDNQTLRTFAGEIAAIGKKTGAEIHVLVFDTEVLSHTKMQGQDWDTEITKLEFARGGGTDFKPVIARAMELEPSIIVILTDLYADFGEAPKAKVVWAVEEETSIVPPYGRVITMER